jgi:hypothetical protein
MTPAIEIRRPDPAGAVQFVDQVHDAFVRACSRTGRVEKHFQVAGSRFSLALAGTALEPVLTPAFAHLRTPPAGEGLTIHAWDAHSTGISPPPPVWSRVNYYGNSEVRGFAGGRICAAFDVALGMLSVYDIERRMAFVWLRGSRPVPVAILGTPLRIVLQWWADEHDRVLIHAAAVGTAEGAVVIAGASGAGKSTTALLALTRGLLYLGDDFVLVQPEPLPRVHALYCSAKIDADTLAERFPALRATTYSVERGPGEKQVLFVHSSRPHQVPTSLPIRAVLLPVITNRASSRLIATGSGDALRALVPGVLPVPGMRRFAVGRLARLSRKVPAYRFELGRDAGGISDTLLSALQKQ